MFFNVGNGLSLSAVLKFLPFKKEYGFATWFRFDTLPLDCTLLSIEAESGIGIKVTLEALEARSEGSKSNSFSNSVATLVISSYDHSGKENEKSRVHQVRVKGCILCPRIWYHVAVRHSESRYKRYFSNALDEITVLVDGKIMLTEELRFPKISVSTVIGNKLSTPATSTTPLKIQFASNFDGQTGALYIFKDFVSDATFQALFEVTSGAVNDVDSGKSDDDWSLQRGEIAKKANSLRKDNFPLVSTKVEKGSIAQPTYKGSGPINGSQSASLGNIPDKGQDDDPDEFTMHPLSKVNFGLKLLLIWDPSRVFEDMVLEGYMGAHVVMDFNQVQPWYKTCVNDVLSSIGGIQSLLYLFETILTPHRLDKMQGTLDHNTLMEPNALNNSDLIVCSKGTDAWILPYLFTLLATVIMNSTENIQELHRCGGIEILEQYLFSNKMTSISEAKSSKRSPCEFLMKRTSESLAAAKKLVEALENLRRAASHDIVLESKIFSRLVFNIPLWLVGTSKLFGSALFATFLRFYSSVTMEHPGKIRDCIDVRDLFTLVNELIEVGGTEDDSIDQNKFGSTNEYRWSLDASNIDSIQRRHAVSVILGIYLVIISSRSTVELLSPFINFVAFNLDDEWEKASADGQSESFSDLRVGSRRERYIASCKACSILLFLLQRRPPISGLHSSFEKYLHNANGITSFILCGMVNSFDDYIRSLGIRCLTKFLECIESSHNGIDKAKFDKYSVDNEGKEIEVTQDQIVNSESTLSKTMKYVGTGLRNMRANTMNTNNLFASKASVNIAHKLLWHLLKCHREGLNDFSHAALVDLLLDYGEETNASSHFSFSLNDVMATDQVLQGGFQFNDDWAKFSTTLVGIESSHNLRNIFAVGTILRLLRFLPNRMKERWLFDLLALIRVSPKSIENILLSKDWQPCLFHLLSENVEEIDTYHQVNLTSDDQDAEKASMQKNSKAHDLDVDLKVINDVDEVSNRNEYVIETQVNNEKNDPNEDNKINNGTDDIIFPNKTSESNVGEMSNEPEADSKPEGPILSRSDKLGLKKSSSVTHIDSLRARFDLVLKLYSTLLGQSIRHGGNKAFRVVEQAASMQRVCINGHEVFLIILSHLLAELVENGTVVDIESLGLPEQSNPNERNRALKQSARIVTTAILSNGSEGMDMSSAVQQWRSLRHLTAITVAVLTRSGFGVANLFDTRIHTKLFIDAISKGIFGIRLEDGNISGISASASIRNAFRAKRDSGSNKADNDDHLLSCVTLATLLLSLLDAFIFPDSLDASLPASQLHGLSLVRGTEPRLGKTQGSLLASLLRISLLLIAYLEPSSVKFLQCCSRLRCFLHWTLELIRESAALAGYAGAFQELTAPLDRLVLAVVLQCHHSLFKCSSVLNEIESNSTTMYFSSADERQKNIKRLFRSTSELREIILAAFRGRNEVLRAGLSLEAYELLEAGLRDIMSIKNGKPSQPRGGTHVKRVKESNLRNFMQNDWVNGFNNVKMYGEIAVPEMVSDGQHYRNRIASVQGRKAIEELHNEGNKIILEYENALNLPFDEYCEGQRLWAETDAVRDMEYEGDLAVKRLAHGFKVDMVERKRLETRRTEIAAYKIDRIHDNSYFDVRKLKHKINCSSFWKLDKYPDRLHRRILLVKNKDFNSHMDASYEDMIGKERMENSASSNKIATNNSDVLKRASEGILPYKPPIATDFHGMKNDDTDLLSEGGNGNTSKIAQMSIDEVEPSQLNVDLDSEWDYIEPEMDIGDLNNDIDVKKDNFAWAKDLISSDDEKPVQFFENVTLVSLQSLIEGILLLTTHSLFFHPTGDKINVMTKEKIDCKGTLELEIEVQWKLCSLTEIYGRLYMLRAQAVELFFADAKEMFISFGGGTNIRDRFYSRLRSHCKTPMLKSYRVLNPRVVFKRSKITDLWRKRKISTFEYIMQLNIIAGRTFNDITQYPVFPWVLADYTSKTLDLSDSRVFRDLSKPVGALNPNRLAQLIERFNDLDGFPEEEKFLYGSHYSSPGVVLHYLIRQEPFTTMAIELQSGRFDCPDRLFYDIEGSWRSCMTSTSDVKELIPEFFTCPEIFLNTNKFPLGETQSKISVNDVKLPPWANGSVHEFVRLHRLALESEYVSQNLHHWIDLIFGYKQRGPEAAAAYNMFHYLSYEGSVDLDKITDEVDRKATESHIQNFGQTPSQLLVKEPHPIRYPLEDCWSPLLNEMSQFRELRCFTPPKQFGGPNKDGNIGAVLSIHVANDTVAVVYENLSVGTYKWSPAWSTNFPISFRMEKIKVLGSTALSLSQIDKLDSSNLLKSSRVSEQKKIIGNWSFGLTLGGSTRDNFVRRGEGQKQSEGAAGGKPGNIEASGLLISCGYWDETIKVHTIDGLRLKCSENGGHRGPVTCMSMSNDGGLMVTGGQDATCRVWVIDHSHMANAISSGYIKTGSNFRVENGKCNFLSCCHILWGHETEISCISFQSDLDIKVSGSVDGVICIHSVRRGIFIRTIHVWENTVDSQHDTTYRSSLTRGPACVRKLALDAWGNFVAYLDDGMLYVYTVNGTRLGCTDTGETLHAIEISSDGKMLVTGGENCKVVIRTVHDLAVQCVLDLTSHGPIQCIAFTPAALNPLPQFMFVGTKDGKITIVDRDPVQEKEKNNVGSLPHWTTHDGNATDEGGNWWSERRSKSVQINNPLWTIQGGTALDEAGTWWSERRLNTRK